MFLVRKFQVLRDGERGSALAAVIAIFGITMLLAMVAFSATTTAVAFTSGTRAGVQSQAAADAGVAVARAALASKNCEGTGLYPRTASPEVQYKAQIQYWNGTGWVSNCPPDTAESVRVVSTGTAASAGTGGNTRGDERSVEAVFAWTPKVPDGITATGAAVYMYNQGVLNNAELLQDGARTATIMVRNGDVNCTTASRIQGDIIAAAGKIAVGSTCVVDADVRASGTVDISGKVGGHVSAAGSGQSIISPEARIGGSVSLKGTVNAWGTRCPAPNGGWDALGNACSVKQTSGASSVKINMTGADAPVAPVVPGWIDFAYNPADWTGWDIVQWSGADQCTLDNRTSLSLFATRLSSYTTPTVIDATACGELNFSRSSGFTMDMKTNITFIAKSFSIEGFTAKASSGVPQELRFITPDAVADGLPTCPSGSRVKIDSGVNINTPVASLIYSPCTISNSDNDWRGQFYAGSVKLDTNSGLKFVGVGLPGVDMGNGTVTPTNPSAGNEGLGALTSYRQIPRPA